MLKNFLVAMALGVTAAGALAAGPVEGVTVRAYFSPNGGVESAVTQAIDAARESISVSAFHFDSKPIAKALVRAHKRGVKVRFSIDAEAAREKGCRVDKLIEAGIPVRIDARHHTAHSKSVVIDERRVVTGSANFNEHAERDNAENLLVLDSVPLARLYLEEFNRHWSHGRKH